ncbi:DUF748 domain-containing protein [Cryomorphaceae bacterium 1068]|nr:DUF748 domain-containing protein [Cryomorphaceae bacterium 1068]
MKTKYKWLLTGLVLLIGFRIALPFIMKGQINKNLDNIEGYNGAVADVDLQLYRGGFQIENLKIFEEASEKPEVPLVDLAHLDFSIEWRALLKGSFVGEVYLDSLLVNFTQRKSEEINDTDTTDARIELIKEIQSFNPIKINILEVKNSQLVYFDPTSEPVVDIELKEFYLRAENLGNVVNEDKDLPASLVFKSTTRDSGSIHLEAQMNYLMDPPDFDFDLEIERIDIPRFNEFFDAYANLDFESGYFNFYSEGKARDGEVEGYAKPLIEGLEVAKADSSEGLVKKIYRGAVEVGTDLFKNQEEDQIGTKVPISGSFNDSEVDILQSIWNFIKNAFFEAYRQEIERSISFNSGTDKEK